MKNIIKNSLFFKAEHFALLLVATGIMVASAKVVYAACNEDKEPTNVITTICSNGTCTMSTYTRAGTEWDIECVAGDPPSGEGCTYSTSTQTGFVTIETFSCSGECNTSGLNLEEVGDSTSGLYPTFLSNCDA